MNLQEIQILVLDVDGVLTPGDVTFDDRGGRIMSFDIHDGSAIKRWHDAGHRTIIISGRKSTMVDRRAAELGIAVVEQGVTDKPAVLLGTLDRLDASPSVACAIGDDVADAELLSACDVAVAVANAVPMLKRRADYITRRVGGRGAVAEVIDLILRKQRPR